MITYSATRCNNSAIRSKYFNIAIIYVRTNIGKIMQLTEETDNGFWVILGVYRLYCLLHELPNGIRVTRFCNAVLYFA